MVKRYGPRARQRLIAAVRKSGEPIKVVAKRHGVAVSTAYLWMNRARREQGTAFARVVPSTTPRLARLVIEVGGVAIRIDEGFDAKLLRDVVSALGEQS